MLTHPAAGSGATRATPPTTCKKPFYDIAADFAAIPVTRVPKVKVGVVGEIYVKYSPLGNNDLEKFLACQDCEVNLPGLMGFVQYCVDNHLAGHPTCTAATLAGRAGVRRVPGLAGRHREAPCSAAMRTVRLPRARLLPAS